LISAATCLVCVIWMMRAYPRGEHHIVARLAATIALTLVAHIGYDAYRGRSNAIVAGALAAFALVTFSIAIAKGRFHAPPL
jgi:heme A synthase